MDQGKAGGGRGGQGAGEADGEGAGGGIDSGGGTGEDAGVDSGGVAGEEMGAGGEGGPAISATACRGHKERKTLEKTMSATRTIKKAKTKLVSVKMPNQPKPVKKSLTQLIELFKETKEWKLILEGGTLAIPVFVFLKQAAKTKKKSGPSKLKISETKERIEQTITEEKDEFLKQLQWVCTEMEHTDKVLLEGHKLRKAEDELIQNSKAYETYRKVAADKAELDLRDGFSSMQNGGLFIMSMEMKSVRKICEDLGFQSPKHEGEIDAIYIFAEGDKLRVKLCEVKRPCSFPWHTASEGLA